MTNTIFMASEVRSGSTYVAEVISYYYNNILGYSLFDLGKELFSGLSNISTASDVLDIYNQLYLDKSGWRSSKIMCASLSIIVRESRKSSQVQSSFFGDDAVWIVVRRRDRIAQAVSLAMAKKSGVYHYYGEKAVSADESQSVGKTDIDVALHSIELSDLYLDNFKSLIKPDKLIELFYEDFRQDAVPTINKLSSKIGVQGVSNVHNFLDLAKLKRTATRRKADYTADFKIWFTENYHPT